MISFLSPFTCGFSNPPLKQLLIYGQFFLGTTLVLLSTFLYSYHDHHHVKPHGHSNSKPPPIRINSNEKPSLNTEDMGQSQDFSIKLPTTPLINEELGRSTSRPGSPAAGGRHHARVGTGERGYFGKMA